MEDETMIEKIKQLRTETLAGIADCKQALIETEGDIEKAKKLLKARSKVIVERKSGREMAAGQMASYVHQGGKVVATVEVRCETDFVAKSEPFQVFLKELCLHVASMNPRWVSPSHMSAAEVFARRCELEDALFEDPTTTDKPKEIQDKILEGKIKKDRTQTCLTLQPWVKDTTKTIQDLLDELIGKVQENCEIAQFVRWKIQRKDATL